MAASAPQARRRRSRPVALGGALAALVVLAWGPECGAGDFEASCREVLATEVTTKVAIDRGEPYARARERALQQADREAVSQTVGAWIRARARSELSAEGDRYDQRFLSRMREQTAGHVRRRVLGERVEQAPSGSYLEVHTSAEVCVPRDPTVLKEVVRTGSFVGEDGAPARGLAALAAEVFSRSSGYVLAAEGEGDLADVELSGAIESVRVHEIEVDGRPMMRLDLRARLEAENLVDGTREVESVEDYAKFAASGDPAGAARRARDRLLLAGMRRLHDRLLAARPGGPAPARARLGQTEGDW